MAPVTRIRGDSFYIGCVQQGGFPNLQPARDPQGVADQNTIATRQYMNGIYEILLS